MPRPVPQAPTWAAIEQLKTTRRARRGGRLANPSVTMSVSLEVVTPIFGGGTRPREVDDVDIIRVPNVRGHLRFWWRALHAHEARFASAADLAGAERELWGGAGDTRSGADSRSTVDVRISVHSPVGRDERDPREKYHPSDYALWPAGSERNGREVSVRYQPGVQFELKLTGPRSSESELRNALMAWFIFGGYGGRTRRGLGSLYVARDALNWLPGEPTLESLNQLFGRDVFIPQNQPANATSLLAGAALHLGAVGVDPSQAWMDALLWLRDFRQGTDGSETLGVARRPDPRGGNRPSTSNWPEADTLRNLSRPVGGLHWAQTPAHSSQTLLPRAAFGLPIGVRFQMQSREERAGWRKGEPNRFLRWAELPLDHPNRGNEPGGQEGFQIRWRSNDGEHERLASPLIVKALPLAPAADGTRQFASCSLWLNRRLPDSARAVVAQADPQRPGRLRIRNESATRFDVLEAPPIRALFPALRGKATLKDAFLDWLEASPTKAQRIAR